MVAGAVLVGDEAARAPRVHKAAMCVRLVAWGGGGGGGLEKGGWGDHVCVSGKSV